MIEFKFFKQKEKININNILKKINNKNIIKRYLSLIFALLLSAISYNLFFVSGKIVVGGISGIAIIVKSLLNINPSMFILIINLILIIFSFFLLGKSITIRNLIGSLVYPVFISITSNLTQYIDINQADLFVKSLYGAVLTGISGGIIFKVGFSSGGTDIITQILSKYSKISIGKATLFVNTIIIGSSGFVFGWTNVMYAIISLYIISVITDKVLLGISNNKAFLIITSKEEEIKNFIIETLEHSVTILKSQGGFSNKNKNVIMVVIPTKEYFILKESIHEIDKDSFFVVTDSYQVLGGE